MKKLFALVMAVLMTFSIALVPMAASEAEVEAEVQEITVDGVFDAIENAVIFVFDAIEKVHNIVGKIMAIGGAECGLCGELHEITSDEIVDAFEKIEIPEIAA